MKNIVILADGEFPTNPVPAGILESAEIVVCCDGAAARLTAHHITPYAIVGDMDSLQPEIQRKFSKIIHKNSDQETNDLTKAFEYSLTLSPDKISILGAAGLREDHTIGNISLIAQYIEMTCVPVELYTNYGKFICADKSAVFPTEKGKQISIFALDPRTRIISAGLKYPLNNVIFDSWWKGTLNEASDDSIMLNINFGKVIIFFAY